MMSVVAMKCVKAILSVSVTPKSVAGTNVIKLFTVVIYDFS